MDEQVEHSSPDSPCEHPATPLEVIQAAATASEEELEKCNRRPIWKNARIMVPLWTGMVALVALGWHFGVDKKLLASGFVLIGLLSNAFTWMVALIAAVPLIGPLVIKILAIPFIWLLNAIGYLVSIVAIRRGYSKDVLAYRGLTIALIIGITIGFIIGKLV